MGGTIVKLARQGHKVHVVDMTNGEPTPRGSVEIRAAEAAAAARAMGVERTLLGLKNREVVHDVPSRHKLAALIRVHRPGILFLPYPIDAHPDHVAVTKIGEDARFDAKLTKSDIPGEPWHPRRIFNYYCVHLKHAAQPAFILDVSPYWEKKIAAISSYHSQFIEGRPTAPPPSSINSATKPRTGANASALPTGNHSQAASRLG